MKVQKNGFLSIEQLQDKYLTLAGKSTGNQIERLKEGAQKAQEKGIRESLVIVDQLAFIVNIPNNTVVTAMNHGDTAENIFTNIDGAVII